MRVRGMALGSNRASYAKPVRSSWTVDCSYRRQAWQARQGEVAIMEDEEVEGDVQDFLLTFCHTEPSRYFSTMTAIIYSS